MKHNSPIISFVISFFAITSILTTSLAEAASVRSLSRETQVEVDGKTFIEVSVNCARFSKPRVISRASGVNKWCAKNDPTACYSGKIRAARKACSYRTTTTAASKNAKTPEPKAEELASTNPATNSPAASPAAKKSAPQKPEAKASAEKAPAAKTAKLGPNGKTRSELMKEYIQIEEQRILVEQQKLELNKRELEIQKRELAL